MGKLKLLGLGAVAIGMISITGCDGDTTTIINGETSAGPSECMTVIGYPYSDNNDIQGLLGSSFELAAMAFKGDKLYVASTDRGEYSNYLFSVDLETGDGTPIDYIGRTFDLASDPLDTNPERLYAMDRGNEFKDINVTSGDTNNIEEEISYDTITFTADGTAYATDGNELYQLDINHTTGEIIDDTYIGNVLISFHSIAYNSADGKLYGTPQYDYTGTVLRIDVGGFDDVNLTYVNKVDCLQNNENDDGDCRLGGIDFKDGIMYGAVNWGSDYPREGALVKWNSSCGDYTGGAESR